MEAGKSRCGEIPGGVMTWESGMAFGALPEWVALRSRTD